MRLRPLLVRYGQGRSERLLGHALKGVPRKAYYINSKIGRYDQVRDPPPSPLQRRNRHEVRASPPASAAAPTDRARLSTHAARVTHPPRAGSAQDV